MEKISIESSLISEEKTFFKGRGILKNNEIIFFENDLKTKIIVDKASLTIIRQQDYLLKMEFIRGKNTKATYNMYGKSFDLDIFTNELKIEKNKVFINYDLTVNKDEKMNFIYNLEYSIDS